MFHTERQQRGEQLEQGEAQRARQLEHPRAEREARDEQPLRNRGGRGKRFHTCEARERVGRWFHTATQPSTSARCSLALYSAPYSPAPSVLALPTSSPNLAAAGPRHAAAMLSLQARALAAYRAVDGSHARAARWRDASHAAQPASHASCDL